MREIEVPHKFQSRAMRPNTFRELKMRGAERLREIVQGVSVSSG
jgi:hypothetical protein